MTGQDQTCFHCNLPVPADSDYAVKIEGKVRPMCCPGCQAVAQAIVDNGLEDFYKYRTEPSKQSSQLIPQELANLDLYDNPVIQKNFVHATDADIKQASLILEGIVCAACVWLSEHHVQKIPGVIRFQVNYSTHRAQLEWDDQQVKLSEILKAIRDIGYLAHPLDPNRQEQVFKKERSQAIRRIAVAGLGAMQVMMLAVALYAGDYEGMDSNLERFLRWVSLFITTPVLLYSARPFFVAAMRDLKMRGLGMDVPVALAISAAYAASAWATISNSGEVYFDSVTMFTFFLLSGRFLEMTARQRAGRAAEELVKLIPAMATRFNDDQQQVVAVSELVTGDLILVKPGESIPADSIVVQGRSSVDESLLTGESMPVVYREGDQVVAGSVNIESSLKLKVEALGTDTILASIQRLLERAQTEKPKLAVLADKVAGYFVFALLVIALTVGGYWWWVDPQNAFWIVISVLVVTCPCALSLATPTALTAAMGKLTKLGMLTTRGHALETLAKVSHVVFDKTGTLTEGKLVLSNIQSFTGLPEQQSLLIASSIEQFSEHPIGKCLHHSYQGDELLEVSDVENVPGMGMQAVINNQQYFIGHANYIKEKVSFDLDDVLLNDNRVILSDQQQLLAAFTFEDKIRASAKTTIQQLHDLGIKTVILSGDQQANVDQVASQIGVTQAFAGFTPNHKLDKLSALQQQGAIIAMVGDGINDAPVLSKAQVSIAMGQGTQIAQASADMILLSDNLSHIVSSIETSKATRMVIRQNLIWALLYNLVALPLAAMGWVAPWMAAIGMSASSLIVVLNALRLTSPMGSNRGNAVGSNRGSAMGSSKALGELK